MSRSSLLPVLLVTGVLTACAGAMNQTAHRDEPASSGLLTVEEIERRADRARQDSIRAVEEARLREQARQDSIRAAEDARLEQIRQDSIRTAEAEAARQDSIARAEESARQDSTANAERPTQGAEVETPTQPRAAGHDNPFTIGETPRDRTGRQEPTGSDRQQAPRQSRDRGSIDPRSDNPRRVTVNFLDTPIEDVIAAFGSWANRSILMGEGVRSKKITADIYNQPWHIALEQILAANGLEASEHPETGIISIRGRKEAREQEADARSAPEVYKINYAEASEVAQVLADVLGEKVSVTQVESTNSLLISASEETLAEVEGLIAKIDVRQPTVTIQAKIVSIARSEMESLGLRYSIEDPTKPYSNSGSGSTGGSMSGMSGMPQVVIEPSGLQTNHPPLLLNRKGNATFSTFLSAALAGTPYSLTAFVDALQGVSLAEVHAAPVITTISDKSASIEVGDAFHVPTVINSGNLGGQQGGGGSGGSGVTSNTSAGGHNVIRVGITLDVTPHVTNNGKIWLEIKAKRSGGEIDAGGTVKESFQSGNTEMIVDNGETAVIGGLTLTETSSGHTGVPILKDLPVIGRLFRTESRVRGERDLIILVTPTIVDYEDYDFQRSK